jgi:nucleoside-diphosphate-sugar epimerase
MTLRGYAEGVARWFGQEPRLSYLPWEEWRKTVSPKEAEITLDHISHSPHCSMAKAARLLGFKPSYSALGATLDALGWLVEHGKLTVRPLD